MLCKDIMKKDVRCLDGSASVQEAAQLMRDMNVGFVPICDRSGKVVGTLTDRDIAIRVAADGRAPAGCKVADVMTREVVSSRPDDEVAVAERQMADNHKSRIMIIDAQETLIGVISLSDIAEHDSLRRTAATMRGVAARETRA
jgi:CBS domain-containing protein